MFNLERLEKLILVFLLGSLLLGVGITAYRKAFPTGSLSIESCSHSSPEISGSVLIKSGKVNINTASCEELMKLQGIGRVLAGRIVEYRSRNGLFISPEDLKKVPGIGDKLFAKIKDSVSLE